MKKFLIRRFYILILAMITIITTAVVSVIIGWSEKIIGIELTIGVLGMFAVWLLYDVLTGKDKDIEEIIRLRKDVEEGKARENIARENIARRTIEEQRQEIYDLRKQLLEDVEIVVQKRGGYEDVQV